MENIGPIKNLENSVISGERAKEQEFGWSDEEIREVLKKSPFYGDLSEKAVNDLIKRIQMIVKESKESKKAP